MLWLKLNHVSKRGPWSTTLWQLLTIPNNGILFIWKITEKMSSRHEMCYSSRMSISVTWKREDGCPHLFWFFFNSLAPVRCSCHFKLLILKLISKIDILSISCDIAFRWMSQDLIYDKSILMVLCHQATNHHPNQCRLWSMFSYGVTSPEWVHLTHWHPSKMTYILQITFSSAFPNENYCIFIQISQEFVLMGQIDNKSALLQVPAPKSLPEAVF